MGKSDMAIAVYSLRSVFDGGPIHVMNSGMRLPNFDIMQVSNIDHASADGFLKPTYAPLLPSYLPPVPPPLRGARVVASGRRCRQRTQLRAMSRVLAEWQLTILNGLEGNFPKSPKSVSRFLGPARVTSQQWLSFRRLVVDCRRFCRTRTSFDAGPGRGQSNLATAFAAFEHALHEESSAPSHSLSQLSKVAQSLTVENMNVLDKAGLLRPETFLDDDKAALFLDSDRRIDDDSNYVEPPYPCHAVKEGAPELAIAMLLLRSGTATLIDEVEVPTRRNGEPLVGGLFGVPHKQKLRVIFDRRPQNANELRLNWLRLPGGSQLTRLVLGRRQGLRASGTDLRTWFSQLREAPNKVHRQAFGRSLSGAHFGEFGALADRHYRLAMRVVAMGDLNGCDIASETHSAILRLNGCLNEGRLLIWGRAIPLDAILEGLYIDDYVVLGIMDRHDLKVRGKDTDVCQQAVDGYDRFNVLRSPEKDFGSFKTGDGASGLGDENFVAWGTSVSSGQGFVETPLVKRAHLFIMALRILTAGKTHIDIIRRLVALHIHPFLHRREMLSIFHGVFKWIDEFRIMIHCHCHSLSRMNWPRLLVCFHWHMPTLGGLLLR